MFTFLCALFLCAGLVTVARGDDQPAPWLAPTVFIDCDHPDVIRTTARITADQTTDREKAVVLHDFVRDEIAFGWTGSFYRQKASAVLRDRIGYCNTKSTLFVALIRAAGIPARQHFVDLDASILHGLISPGGRWVDHSYTEVWLEGRWIKTDSYIVDRPLAEAAQARLRRENRLLGYGIHREGTITWNGRDDRFAQYVITRPDLTSTDYGVFADIGAFYAQGPRHNRLNLALRIAFPFFARQANRAVQALRTEAIPVR